MLSLFYQWIDLLWLPVGLATVHKGQRLKTLAFIGVCIMTLRTQIELMESTGHPNGFLHLVHLGIYERGLIIYGLLIGVFLILAHLSPNTRGVIFLAAALSLYIFGFCISMLAMAL
ncbi:MAG TPA: hypothetical protein VIF12_05470 [Micavibrio sp.]|jgi:hypothetical protein